MAKVLRQFDVDHSSGVTCVEVYDDGAVRLVQAAGVEGKEIKLNAAAALRLHYILDYYREMLERCAAAESVAFGRYLREQVEGKEDG